MLKQKAGLFQTKMLFGSLNILINTKAVKNTWTY